MNRKGIWILGGGLLLLGLSALVLWMAIFIYFGVLGEDFEASGDLAVVEIQGPIFESKEIVDQLDRVEKNESIKGLILRLNTPGGGVGASQEIYQAVLRIRKNKKVVASLGGIAASGGYYIAVAADQIVANPGTITGSVGVLMDYANVQSLLDFLKIHAELITAGDLKDVGSPLKPLSETDRAFLQSILDNMHEQFKRAVQEGRKLSDEQMKPIGDGRIFTGEQALAAGLVDKLGNRQVAVDVAKELAGIEGEPKLLYPKKKKMNLMELLLESDLEATLLKGYYALREGRALYLTKGIVP